MNYGDDTMSKLALLLVCLLLGSCQNDTQINTVDEIMQCEGVESTCEILIDEVVEKLPIELQDKIVDTSDRLVIYTGEKQDFLDYMAIKEKDIKSKGYSGVTLYTYQQPTRIYALADSYVIFHELGHAYDFTYWHEGSEQLLSDSEEWVDAYNTEFISQYGKVSVGEFYAETFAMYFRNPKLLQKFCPKAYALHDEEFKDFK